MPLIPLRLLLLSRDFALINEVCNLAQPMRIYCEICADSRSALKRLCKAKYEGVVIDYQAGPDTSVVLDAIHNSTSHHSAITFGVVESPQNREAFHAGLHFVINRPLDSTKVRRTLRAALPLLIQERRRYFRAPVGTAVTLTSAKHAGVAARSLNLSQGGMALECDVALAPSEKLLLEFSLPGLAQLLQLHAEVCWTRDKLAGLQFQHVPPPTLETLQSWLAQRLEEDIPKADPA